MNNENGIFRGRRLSCTLVVLAKMFRERALAIKRLDNISDNSIAMVRHLSSEQCVYACGKLVVNRVNERAKSRQDKRVRKRERPDVA